MALEGDLSEFPLTDIIQLVDLSKKTGAVQIHGQRGDERMEGWLYFQDGKIIGAKLAKLPPLEAAYTFFTFSSGPFRFDDMITLDQPTITVSNEVIIMEGIMRQDAWATIQQGVPSLSLVPRLIPNPTTGTTEINLEAEEWRVLTMINGRNTVDQIAQRSGLGEFRTCEIIAQLLANGLIEMREPESTDALATELERIAVDVLDAQALSLLQEAAKQANVTDFANASFEQFLAIVDRFELLAAQFLGQDPARNLAVDMRSRIHSRMD
jgi:hypothetical protein